MRRVVVTGMGIFSSIGKTPQEITTSLCEGKSGIVYSEEYAKYGFRSLVQALVKGFDPKTIERKHRRHLGVGRILLLGCAAMKEAVADGRLTEELMSSPMTGVIVGTGGPSTQDQVEASIKTMERGAGRIGALKVVPTMSSGFAAALSTFFAIRGINFSITSACATSAHALGEAWWMIRTGRQNIIFAGGAEDCHWTKVQGFDGMRALSCASNNTPGVASRAYDRDRDGFVAAEGAGIVVLEELEHAKARGAHIHAEVLGYGATSDGHSMTAPSGEGAVRCMQQALATTEGRKIDYINPHGTSTPIGDGPEIEAIKEVFGEDIPPIASTKSLTGHSLGAAGVQEAIYTILMMNAGFICASAHIDNLDPAFAGVPIVRKRIDGAEINLAMSNSFGFGGTNACLVLARFVP
ncbi:beta-ketoacyl-ACP synthase I [Candidatus Pacebacteria bacterium]|nr:beta-ketoacyl-ACP synthase I [Candidatus Paceibacterota bacterium]